MSSSGISLASALAPDGSLRVTVAGELDLGSEAELVAYLETSLTDLGEPRVVLDLAPVTFIDSSGLRAVLRCKELAAARSVTLVLSVVPGPVDRLLEVAGVRSWFDYA